VLHLHDDLAERCCAAQVKERHAAVAAGGGEQICLRLRMPQHGRQSSSTDSSEAEHAGACSMSMDCRMAAQDDAPSSRRPDKLFLKEKQRPRKPTHRARNQLLLFLEKHEAGEDALPSRGSRNYP